MKLDAICFIWLIQMTSSNLVSCRPSLSVTNIRSDASWSLHDIVCLGVLIQRPSSGGGTLSLTLYPLVVPLGCLIGASLVKCTAGSLQPCIWLGSRKGQCPRWICPVHVQRAELAHCCMGFQSVFVYRAVHTYV